MRTSYYYKNLHVTKKTIALRSITIARFQQKRKYSCNMTIKVIKAK